MRVLALLVAACAAVAFPILLVVCVVRFILILILAPLLGIICTASWKVREWSSRKRNRTQLLPRR